MSAFRRRIFTVSKRFLLPSNFKDARVEFTDPAMKARMDARHAEFDAQLKTAEKNFKEYQDTMMAKLVEVLRAQPDSKVKATLPELTKRLIREDAGNLTPSQDPTFTKQEKVHYLDLSQSGGHQKRRDWGANRRQDGPGHEPVAHTAEMLASLPCRPIVRLLTCFSEVNFIELGEAVEPGFLVRGDRQLRSRPRCRWSGLAMSASGDRYSPIGLPIPQIPFTDRCHGQPGSAMALRHRDRCDHQ